MSIEEQIAKGDGDIVETLNQIINDSAPEDRIKSAQWLASHAKFICVVPSVPLEQLIAKLESEAAGVRKRTPSNPVMKAFYEEGLRRCELCCIFLRASIKARVVIFEELNKTEAGREYVKLAARDL